MTDQASSPLVCRGVRGATTAPSNTRDSILAATRELLGLLVEANGIRVEDVASAFFTTTADLNAEYPALAARQLGWGDVALMCSHEMAVPGGLPMCIRVLVHWNTPRPQAAIQHVYIRGAIKLRPDRRIELAEPPEENPLPEETQNNLSQETATNQEESQS